MSLCEKRGGEFFFNLGEHAVSADTDDSVQMRQRQRLQKVPRMVSALRQHNLERKIAIKQGKLTATGPVHG